MSRQAVIFDFGRVLAAGANGFFEAIEREYGVSRQIFRPLISGPDGVENAIGGKPFSTGDMVPTLAERLQPHFGGRSREAATKICSVYSDPAAMEEIEPMITLLRSVHRAGLAVGILSNGPSDMVDGRLAKVLALGCVDAIVLSGADGVGKPAPGAFALILQRLNVDPADAWFVDDDPGHVRAGAAMGINSIVFEGDATRLEAELRATGLRW